MTTREVEPHRLVHTPRRWYLLAWDLDRGRLADLPGRPHPGPAGPPGPASPRGRCPPRTWRPTCSQSISSAPYRYQARILIPRAAGGGRRAFLPDRRAWLEAAGPDACILHTGSNSLDELALYVGLKGFDFQVLDPPELIAVLQSLSERLGRGAGDP